MKGDDLFERLLDFAVRVLKVAGALPKTVGAKHVASQLVRCGTAGGSNYEEARGAESRADFIHKLAVAWKEVRETAYWLKLCDRAQLIQSMASLIGEADQLRAILSKSLKTARRTAPA